MTRNLKVLGLVLAAVFAFGALSVSSASAVTSIKGKFWADGVNWHVFGEQPAGKPHIFYVAGGKLTCEVAKFTGETVATTDTESITVQPAREKCTLHNEVLGTTTPATVTTNGCTYTFTIHSHETKGGEGTVADQFSGDFHLLCPPEKRIEIHVFKGVNHTELTCTWDVNPQTIDKIDYEDHTKSKITVTATKSPVKVTRTSGGLLNCGAAEATAEYEGTVVADVQNSSNETTEGGIKTK